MKNRECKYCEDKLPNDVHENKMYCDRKCSDRNRGLIRKLKKIQEILTNSHISNWIGDDQKEEQVKEIVLANISNPSMLDFTFEKLKKYSPKETSPAEQDNDDDIEIEQPSNTDNPKTLKDFYDLNKKIELFVKEKGDEPYSEEDKALVSRFTGYGGLDKMFPEGEADIGIMFEYFTPEPIVEKMWGLAYKHGYSGGPVLEPSAGTGAFLQYAPKDAEITAYEINPVTAKILSVLYPNANVINDKFETAFIKNRASVKGKVEPKYDLVIGNPPYGLFSGREAAWEKKYTQASNYIDYFITRSLDLLKKDGLLVFVIGGEVAAGATLFMDKEFTRAKKIIREKSTLLDAYRLPNGVFPRTNVLTDIIVLKKK